MDHPTLTADTILKFALFQGADIAPEALQLLATLLKPETFQARDYIINENEHDPRMFFLMKGQVVINKTDENGQVIAIGKADASTHPYFGESILLGKFKKSANVIAHGHCQCLSLSAQDFEAFMGSFPFIVSSIYRNIASQLFDRLSKANNDLLIQGILWRTSGA